MCKFCCENSSVVKMINKSIYLVAAPKIINVIAIEKLPHIH